MISRMWGAIAVAVSLAASPAAKQTNESWVKLGTIKEGAVSGWVLLQQRSVDVSLDQHTAEVSVWVLGPEGTAAVPDGKPGVVSTDTGFGPTYHYLHYFKGTEKAVAVAVRVNERFYVFPVQKP